MAFVSIPPSAPTVQDASQQPLRNRLHGIYVITDERAAGGHEAIARAALAGGAQVLQLRDKSTPIGALIPVALALRRLTLEAGVLLLINDRPDLAVAVEADGVHLGPGDFPPQLARRVLGPHRLIGVSCGDAEEARQAFAAGADYIGAGAVFATATKPDAGAPIGLEVLRSIVDATPLPAAAIGGIDLSNLREIGRTGAAMACVVSAVTQAGDEAAMTAATRALVEQFAKENFS